MRRIEDKFTRLKVSPQRRWQLRKKEKGLCVRCGKNPYVTKGFLCIPCNNRHKELRRK